MKLTSKLFRCDEPLFRIPNLAIHLTEDRKKFEWNNETHLKAILATTVFDDTASKKEILETTNIEKVF